MENVGWLAVEFGTGTDGRLLGVARVQ
ncbi:hypothetical protein CCACVL1_23010 [Corchorus capsularis]|uniref:Uncharacterized protein n=1 Tax=Corchorus capsularis TaxID=210143 RepID=A0A1R3GVR8_COCAP|nr:hypothetical protein CCACVL1_23010 [Corchorus capsularis]